MALSSCCVCFPPEHLLEATQTSQTSKTSIILYVRDYFMTISCKLTGENSTDYKIPLNRSHYTYFSVSEALTNKKSRVKSEQSSYPSNNHELTEKCLSDHKKTPFCAFTKHFTSEINHTFRRHREKVRLQPRTGSYLQAGRSALLRLWPLPPASSPS